VLYPTESVNHPHHSLVKKSGNFPVDKFSAARQRHTDVSREGAAPMNAPVPRPDVTPDRAPGVAPGRLPTEAYADAFADAHPPLTPHEALVAADRCYFCHDAP